MRPLREICSYAYVFLSQILYYTPATARLDWGAREPRVARVPGWQSQSGAQSQRQSSVHSVVSPSPVGPRVSYAYVISHAVSELCSLRQCVMCGGGPPRAQN